MEENKKDFKFDWRWVLFAFSFVAIITSNSTWHGLLIGGIWTAFFFMGERECHDTNVKWIVFVVLLIISGVLGGVVRNHEEAKRNGVEIEYDGEDGRHH